MTRSWKKIDVGPTHYIEPPEKKTYNFNVGDRVRYIAEKERSDDGSREKNIERSGFIMAISPTGDFITVMTDKGFPDGVNMPDFNKVEVIGVKVV